MTVRLISDSKTHTSIATRSVSPRLSDAPSQGTSMSSSPREVKG